ncbi:MAG: nitrogenase component 1 [Veillonellaceae bacterium]|nr:nitrogenase component 1 [Veillonellaceae bacterium]
MDKSLSRWRMAEDDAALLGAAAAFLSFEDCKLVLHSPMWCASITARELVSSYPASAGRIFSTFVTEKDLLFGSENKLVAAVKDANLCADDHLLGVAVNCAPALVGDDVEGICRSVTDTPVAVADASGFSGEFDAGWASAMLAALKKQRIPPREKVPNSVNLIGVAASDQEEMAMCEKVRTELEAAGIRVNYILGAAGTRWQDLVHWRQAMKNIVLSPRGEVIAARMLAAWGEPWEFYAGGCQMRAGGV